MFPVLQVGPLALQVPGLILLLGLWLGLNLSERRAPRHGLEAGHLYNLVFIALIAGITGARLAYVARYPAAFSGNPLSLLSLNPGLLDPWAGLAAGVLAAPVYAQRKKLTFWRTLDALAPMLAVMGVALGLAHLASGDAFGAETRLPWGIELWEARRHPSQVYETLSALLILGIVHFKFRESQAYIPGTTFLSFLAMSSGARLFLEAFRGDSVLMFAGLRAAQVAAWLILATCLVVFGKLKKTDEQGPESEMVRPSR